MTCFNPSDAISNLIADKIKLTLCLSPPERGLKSRRLKNWHLEVWTPKLRNGAPTHTIGFASHLILLEKNGFPAWSKTSLKLFGKVVTSFLDFCCCLASLDISSPANRCTKESLRCCSRLKDCHGATTSRKRRMSWSNRLKTWHLSVILPPLKSSGESRWDSWLWRENKKVFLWASHAVVKV